MDYTFKLTVRDVLQRPHFKQAEVVAGKKGVFRIVDWVHIAEVSQIRHLLNGNELILSTGVGWGKQLESCLSFLKQLIERGSAGLCIELGTYFSEIPEEMLQLADKHCFPLIVFPHEVRFIDITQDLHSVIHESEKRRVHEDRWIRNWLEGRYGEEEISSHLRTVNMTGKPSGIVACIGKIDHLSDRDTLPESTMNQLEIVSRSAFSQQGFFLLSTYDDNRLIYILVDQGKRETWKRRIEKGMEFLKQSTHTGHLSPLHIQFGIGKIADQLSRLHMSFQTAEEALDIQRRVGKRSDVYYEDLHILRMVSCVNETDKLHEFVMDYLEPIIEYDRTHRGEMMHTLKTFLACNGSKQETAARLFIVRQTLYNRLEKLEELLGSDFMIPEKRLAIEFAISAYHYLQSSHGNERG